MKRKIGAVWTAWLILCLAISCVQPVLAAEKTVNLRVPGCNS